MLSCASGKEGAEVMVIRCLCDFCIRVMKQGKYLFANFVEISVEGGIGFSFVLSLCGPFS